jgi:hypothetical protein
MSFTCRWWAGTVSSSGQGRALCHVMSICTMTWLSSSWCKMQEYAYGNNNRQCCQLEGSEARWFLCCCVLTTMARHWWQSQPGTNMSDMCGTSKPHVRFMLSVSCWLILLQFSPACVLRVQFLIYGFNACHVLKFDHQQCAALRVMCHVYVQAMGCFPCCWVVSLVWCTISSLVGTCVLVAWWCQFVMFCVGLMSWFSCDVLRLLFCLMFCVCC